MLGAGVVGVATAHRLAERGHSVEVVDQRSSVARDTSASTAGLIAPGHSYAWASPSAPAMLLRSLRGHDTSIRVVPRVDLDLARWGLMFLRECTSARARRNTLAKLALAQFSQKALGELAAREGIDYRQAGGGILYLYRTAEQLERAARLSVLMRENGQQQRVLDGDEVADIEPALKHSSATFAGAIHDSGDATGDPERFTRALAERCEALGVSFRFYTSVKAIQAEGDSVTRVVTDGEDLHADAFVLTMGPGSARIARTAGVRLPIYPAKGYTLTAPIIDGDRAPLVGGIDEGTLVAWSRFGDELRMSATAEFAGYDRRHTARDFVGILAAGNELFPDAVDWSGARYRTGLRPMTPHGAPIIGAGRHDNLFFNTGHGHVGWTMACGSARLVTDLVEGRRPELDPAPYAPRR